MLTTNLRFLQRLQTRGEVTQHRRLILKRLSSDLSARFGRGFGVVNLQQMRNFYLFWRSQPMYQTVSDTLASSQPGEAVFDAFTSDLPALAQRFPFPWSAYVRLLAVKSPHARQFYETEALRCGWSVRQLDRQIGSQS